MRFLCDHMLAGLGRWLRTAGHDTAIIEDSLDDQEILKKTIHENRLLLTRDRHFLQMHGEKNNILYLKGNSVEECIHELNQKIELDWLYAPFSRCLLCNSSLVKEEDPKILEEVPSDVRTSSHDIWSCTSCKKVYWLGSHTDAMLKQLQAWQQL
jgi:uncharacterized protein with PIN domain